MPSNKKRTKKIFTGQIRDENSNWKVKYGYLKNPPGRPGKVPNLFEFVAEKIPFEFLDALKERARKQSISTTGVYIAHDSMGWPRYIGRGNVFSRLKTRYEIHSAELRFFSAYIIKNTKHTREIETMLIRTAGALLSFNTRKRRLDTATGWITDYEAGTNFAERRSTKGKSVVVGSI